MRKFAFFAFHFLYFAFISTAAPPDNSKPFSQGDDFTSGEKMALSIENAIQLGIKNNPSYKSSSAKINAATGRFWNTISPTPPELTVSFDDIPAGKAIRRYGENNFGVNQSIEFPTNYIFRGSRCNKEISISRQELAQTELDIVSNVKGSYFNVLAFREQIKIADDNLRIAEQFLKKSDIRYNVGEGTNLEKLTAKVQYAEALNNLETQKNHYATALAELNYAMGNGKSGNREYQLTDSLVFSLLKLDIEQLIDQADVNNPLLNVSRLQLEVRAIEKTIAYSSVLPDFSIGAYSKNVNDDTRRYYGVSFGVTVPLWFMFDQNGRIRESSANLQSAESDLHSNENNLHLQIKSAFNRYKDAERQVASYNNEILPQSVEVSRIALKSYESGEITYLEFLEAQQTLIAAQSNYINALLDYNLSIISLEQAVGKNIK